MEGDAQIPLLQLFPELAPSIAEQIEERRLSMPTPPVVAPAQRPDTAIPPARDVKLIFICDSFYAPSHWSRLHAKLIHLKLYLCEFLELGSTQVPEDPSGRKNLRDDTSQIHAATLRALQAGTDVIIIAHGYAGCPPNNALQGLDIRSRTAAGASTCVRGLIFIAAIPLMTGLTVLQQFGGIALDCHVFEANGTFIFMKNPPGAAKCLFNDLPDDEAHLWASNLLGQSWMAYCEQTDHAAYELIPSVYVKCGEDRAFPHGWQDAVIENSQSIGAILKVHEMPDAGHTPFLGRFEDEFAMFIYETVEDLRCRDMQWLM
ncbi:hypothetical protein CKM354_001219800 [Cercospora kikuchii]|uniref:AB hydrolase-1 domain-containing protein n=1 Tax=Cercospora kikuchii TaxID=84275 RepID=A0A9P3FLI4_9PEZI|nr:uncharacterized protein CKM354_001219800 [Cercospora kikuchii]GIZ49162.1 hypothetical protein CKM354_001219800 [Cercospora kikuchii]